MERWTAIVELSEAQVREALASVLPSAELSSFQLIAGGRANTSYVLDTNQDRLVLRLHVHEPRAGAKERALQSLVSALTRTRGLSSQFTQRSPRLTERPSNT